MDWLYKYRLLYYNKTLINIEGCQLLLSGSINDDYFINTSIDRLITITNVAIKDNGTYGCIVLVMVLDQVSIKRYNSL